MSPWALSLIHSWDPHPFEVLSLSLPLLSNPNLHRGKKPSLHWREQQEPETKKTEAEEKTAPLYTRGWAGNPLPVSSFLVLFVPAWSRGFSFTFAGVSQKPKILSDQVLLLSAKPFALLRPNMGWSFSVENFSLINNPLLPVLAYGWPACSLGPQWLKDLWCLVVFSCCF